jgi:hypothetical protein
MCHFVIHFEALTDALEVQFALRPVVLELYAEGRFPGVLGYLALEETDDFLGQEDGWNFEKELLR